MTITATELKTHFGYYLSLAEKEDIFITKNGRAVVKLVSNTQDRVAAMESLFGSIPADLTPEEAREERLDKI